MESPFPGLAQGDEAVPKDEGGGGGRGGGAPAPHRDGRASGGVAGVEGGRDGRGGAGWGGWTGWGVGGGRTLGKGDAQRQTHAVGLSPNVGRHQHHTPSPPAPHSTPCTLTRVPRLKPFTPPPPPLPCLRFAAVCVLHRAARIWARHKPRPIYRARICPLCPSGPCPCLTEDTDRLCLGRPLPRCPSV